MDKVSFGSSYKTNYQTSKPNFQNVAEKWIKLLNLKKMYAYNVIKVAKLI